MLRRRCCSFSFSPRRGVCCPLQCVIYTSHRIERKGNRKDNERRERSARAYASRTFSTPCCSANRAPASVKSIQTHPSSAQVVTSPAFFILSTKPLSAASPPTLPPTSGEPPQLPASSAYWTKRARVAGAMGALVVGALLMFSAPLWVGYTSEAPSAEP
uniref:Transmembrane protein n=1 Tax=uncultured marine virus TaxID=186617 RepID=A0A0F7LAI9_9VIRU|nr:hypothetical protein [uncultured marine virus]